jgi:CNT family concentrative nucleoside transporter
MAFTAYNLVSFAGIFVLMGFAWLFSTNRNRMNWHAIAWGVGLQLMFGLFIFVAPAGVRVFLAINGLVVKVLEPASEGARFLFGPLALPPGTEGSIGFLLAFQALPTIIFFSALMSVLYYYGVMQALIRGFAVVFTKLMRISGAESLCTAANIFVGIESNLTIRPHLVEMTRSELCMVLTSGMATVASSTMALYVFLLQSRFPTIAGHLVSASILSAPAAIVMSKILLPETENPKTLGRTIKAQYDKESNVFEAVINGSMSGAKVVLSIAALLIAVLGLVALADLGLKSAGPLLNSWMHVQIDWTLRGLLGYLFAPFVLVIGVPPADVMAAARIIGERLVLTEVTSYQDLSTAIAAGSIHYTRSLVITTYALCGFAHVASMAIFVGGTAALAPNKTTVLSKIGFRALVAATLAGLMTACVAGTFCNGSSVLLGR